MSAEYDGSIKLGVSVSADTKSVMAELGALRKQIVDMFSSVDKSLAGGSGSFLNLETLLTKISEDISNIGKAISVLPDSKVVQIVETVKQVSSSAKDGATAVEQASQDATKAIDLETASTEELYQARKRLEKEYTAVFNHKVNQEGFSASQAHNSKELKSISAQRRAIETELTHNRGVNLPTTPDETDYMPFGSTKATAYENALKQAEMAVADLTAELSTMASTDDGFEEKTARVKQLSETVALLTKRLEEAKIAEAPVAQDTPVDVTSMSSGANAPNMTKALRPEKYYEVLEKMGQDAAVKYWTQYKEIFESEGAKAASEFSKNFKVVAPVDTEHNIANARAELLALQTAVKQFNAGKLSLSDAELGSTLNKIKELKADIAEMTAMAQQTDADMPLDEEFQDMLERANRLQAKLKEFNKTGIGFGSIAEAQKATAELRELQQAIENYKSEVNSVPQEPVVHTNLTKAIEEYNQLNQVIKQFNAGKITMPDDELGRTLNRIKELKEDIADMTKLAQQADADIPLDEEFADLIARANHLQDKLKEFNKTGIGFASIEDAQKATADLRELQQAIANYRTEVNAVPQDQIIQGDLGKLIEEYNQLNQAVKKFKSTGTGMTDMDFGSAVARMDELKKKITEMQAKLANTPKTGFAGLLQNMNKLGTSIGAVSKIAGGMTSKVGKAISGISKKVSALIKWFRELRGESSSTSMDITKGFKKAMTTFAKVAVGVRSLYMLFRRLRTSVVDALNEMSKQIPEVNAQMSAFKTALNQVKGSLGTAFQPIISAILPMLTRLLNMLNTAMNAIGQFFAVLSGQNKIYKYTAAQVDYAESLDNTGKSAKEAKKALMGFDELNVLPDNSDSGSGGAGGGGTYEEVAVDPNSAISDFAKMLKDAWEGADFFDVGQFLGTKLRDGLNVLDEMITTKGYALAEKIGNVFATLINGIVSVGGLADSIGRTLADVINMAMIGLNTFFTATDWLNVGKFVADTIMSFFDNIDWELLGQTVGNYIMMFANSFYGFVTNIDFESIGQYIATAINNIFDVMGQIDETGLSGWEKIGKSISDAIRGVLNTIITALQGVSWDEIGTAIGELIGSIDWSGIAWDVTRLVGAVVSAIAEGFWNWAETEPISAAIAAMVGVAVVGAKVGPVVANALPFLAKLGEVFSLVAGGAGTLHEAMTVVFGTAQTLFAGIGAIVAGAALAVTNFVSMFVNGFSWIKEILMVVGIAIAAVGAVILGAPAAVAAVVAGIVAAVATLVVLIKEHWTEICNWFTETWNAFKKGWTEFWDGVGEILTNCWSAIKTGVSNAINAVKTTITNVVTAIRTWWTTTWTAIQTTAINIFNGIKTAISNAINAVKTTITNVVNAIKTTWTNILNAIKTTTTNIFNGIKTSITNVINGIKTGITNGLNAVKTVWSNIWNTVKSTTVSIFNGISGTIKGVVNGIIGFINGMVRGVVSGLNAMINAMNKLSFDVPDWVPSIGGKKFGFNIKTITAPQIPYLAQGAVLPPNKPFAAIVGDQKHGTNIEAPLSTIQEAVAEEMAEYIDAMMTGFQAIVDAINNKDLDVRIGDTAIGKAAERYSKRQALVRGTL